MMTGPVSRLIRFLGFVPISGHDNGARSVIRQPASHIAVINLGLCLSSLSIGIAIQRLQVRRENIDARAIEADASPGKAAQSSKGTTGIGVSGRAGKRI